MFQEKTFTVEGKSPLLMHNGQLADPTNEIVKRIKSVTAKSKKTDADLEVLMNLEWNGGLYLADSKPCVPGEVLEALFVEAAKKTRKGKQARAGIYCEESAIIDYGEEKTIEELSADPKYRWRTMVKIKQNKILRTRPIFRQWKITFTIFYDDELFNEADLKPMLELAGNQIGLMDFRPKYGRFTVLN